MAITRTRRVEKNPHGLTPECHAQAGQGARPADACERSSHARGLCPAADSSDIATLKDRSKVP